MDISSSEFVFEKNDAIEHGDMMLPLFDEHKKIPGENATIPLFVAVQ